MAFTPAPPTPDRADKLTFPSRMYNWFVWFVNTVAEFSALGSAYNLATSGTSSTSNNVTTGAKTFTVAAGLGLLPGMPLNIARTSAAATTSMFGYVTAYSGTTLSFNATSVIGTGTAITDWTFSLAATQSGASLGANIFTALQRWTTGSNIASATTIDLTAATGNTVNITGTTTTTGFVITAGQWMELIAPAGWPLTFHATNCNITGGNSYTCAAGDRLFVCKAADGVTYVNISRQDGKSIVTAMAVPVRQTVLAAPVDTSGLPSFLPATSASLVLTTQNVTSTAPLVITASNGSDLNGDLNRVGQKTDNTLSWTVGASVTSYLPVTVNADGTLTAVTPVTLAPIYQWGGAPAVTNNQYTYNIQEGKMYKGNGSVANQVNDVIVGEAVSGATTITSTIAYAVRGRYSSPEQSVPAANTALAIAHNIGVVPKKWQTVLVNKTTEGGYAVDDEIDLNAINSASPFWHAFTNSISRLSSNFIWPSGGTSLNVWNKTTAATATITAGNWRVKLYAERGW